MADLIQIAAKILAQTRAGKLQWESVGADTFSTSVGSTPLTIASKTRRVPLGSEQWYRLTVLDDKGNTVEAVDSDTEEAILTVLYETARRNALKVDQVLDALSAKLDTL